MDTEKLIVTSTRHLLPFANLSSDDFERLCYWVVEESDKFDSVEHFGMTGDKKRDVIGYKHVSSGKREQWYFQCKRYKKITYCNFKEELEGIEKHSKENYNFKPDTIVFVIACPVSPSCKDKIKKYAKLHVMCDVYFWTDVELDKKAKDTKGVVEEFFQGGLDIKDLAVTVTDSVKETISREWKKIIPMMRQTQGELSESDVDKTDAINKEIDETVPLINNGEFEEAKELLFCILGEIKDESESRKKELARIYNNLGVCFNIPESMGCNFVKAIEYFELAFEANPELLKAKVNLATAYLNKSGTENYKKAYDIAVPLWEKSDKENLSFFSTAISAIYYYKSSEDAIKYYKQFDKCSAVTNGKEALLHLMGNLYFDTVDFDSAEVFVNKALDLSPDSLQNLYLKARIFMARAQKEAIMPSDFEVVPKFSEYEGIEKGLSLLEEALGAVENENNPSLEIRIKADMLVCSLWLRRANEAKYRKIRSTIDSSKLSAKQKQRLKIQDFAVELQSRNFETAHHILLNSPDWITVSYEEKKRISYIFFLHGGIQQSNEILEEIEAEAKNRKDTKLFMGMSLNKVLLDNKHLAIKAAKKAVEFSVGTDLEKEVRSHCNALMLRYAPSGEVDRLVDGLFDYNKKFPGDGIIKQVRAIDDEGQPTEEIRTFFQNQHEQYENVKQGFKSHFLPSYYLEKLFNRPYADILSSQQDPDFTINLTIPGEEFTKELSSNLATATHLVMDYAVLLNLSKMNLLGHLSKLDKEIYIAEELFVKIQKELCAFEQVDLRRLWDFLRQSKVVYIIEESKTKFKSGNILELLGQWAVDSIALSKDFKATFVTDDFSLLMLLDIEKIKACNCITLLGYMLDREWIDEKIYSTSLGDLAERFYTFLSFTGDDLFQIVMEDSSKITLRSYHLVNQLFLPGSIATSFTGVFVKFIDLLWKTGSLPEDKINWLEFLTKRVIEFLDNQGGVDNEEELRNVGPDFVKMWVIAVSKSNKDEKLLLKKKVREVMDKPFLHIFRDNIIQIIEASEVG